MINLNLQFFSEDSNDGTVQPEPRRFTQEEVDNMIVKRLDRERSKFDQKIQELQSNQPVAESTPAQENDVLAQALEQTRLLQERLNSIETNQQQQQINNKRNQLLNAGVPEDKLDVVLTATQNLDPDSANILINQFINQPVNSTPVQQGIVSAGYTESDVDNIANDFLKNFRR